MQNKEKQAITEICQEYYIKYDLKDIDFIEKDTGHNVNLDFYTLLVVKEGELLKLDGFYSIDKIHNYLEKAQADKDRKLIYEGNKELIGYILVNNKEENIRDFCDFYSSYEELEAPPTKKQKLEEFQPNTSSANNIASSSYNKIDKREKLIINSNDKKVLIFKCLKEHKYIIDRNINGKTIMCLNKGNKRFVDVLANMPEIKLSKSSLKKYINAFGFQWSDRHILCCIPVNIKTFEKYYLSFLTIFSYKSYEENTIYLNTLYDFYQTPSPKNKKEESSLQENIKEILKSRACLCDILLENHAKYPR